MQNILNLFLINKVNIAFAINGLLIVIFTMISACSLIIENTRKYIVVTFLFAISFLLTIFTKDWIVFLFAWEMVTITTTLMLIWSDKGLAGQYFVIQFLGTSILLYVILLAINNGYSEISFINETWLQNLFIVGFGMKSSIIGLHFWLPPIYSKANVLFNAISSGLVIKLGFITLLKIIGSGNDLLIYLGIIMAIYGGIKSLLARDYKVLLAYSSISHLGFIAVGIGSGTVYGYLGSILYIIVHGLTKCGLFLSCGNLIREYKNQYIDKFHNVWNKKRTIAIYVLISFISLSGVPLMAGYNNKYLIKYGFANNLIFTMLLYLASFITVLYTLRLLYWLIFRDLLNNKEKNNKTYISHVISKKEYISLIVIIILLKLIGIKTPYFVNYYIKDFNFGIINGFIILIMQLVIGLIIFRQNKWFKNERGNVLFSLDNLFLNISKVLYNNSRSLYGVIYKDFQYQLLAIPLFLVILLLWQFF